MAASVPAGTGHYFVNLPRTAVVLVDVVQLRQMRTAIRSAALCCAALLLAGTENAAAAANPAEARINGRWVLDAAASDDFDRKLTKLIEAARERMRPRKTRNRAELETALTLPEDLPAEAPDRIRTRLDEMLRPATTLDIDVHDAQVEILADAGPARVFNLDQTVVRMDASGTAEINTRWSGAALVLSSRYTHHAQRTQQFTVNRAGDLLKVSLVVNDPSTGKLELTSAYRRKE